MENKGKGLGKPARDLGCYKLKGSEGLKCIAGSPKNCEAIKCGPAANQSQVMREEQVRLKHFQAPLPQYQPGALHPPILCHAQSCLNKPSTDIT